MSKPSPLTIAVVGDFGVKSVHSLSVAQLVQTFDPDFVITTGDNLYSTPTVKNYESTIGTLYGEYLNDLKGDHNRSVVNGETKMNTNYKLQLAFNNRTGEEGEVESVLTSTSRRFFPCVGNHDFPYGPYCDYFNLPTYYGIHCEHTDDGDNLLRLRLYSINDYMESDGSFNTPGSIQCRWLTHELQEAQNAGCAWIIVYFHHPIVWSSKTNASKTGKRMPVRFPFEQYGVALVFCGHQHFYERIQLEPPRTKTTDTKTQPQSHTQTQSLQQIIVGTGGHSLRPGPSRGQGRLPGSVILDDSGYGALKLEVTDRELKGTYCVVSSPDQENTNRKKGGRRLQSRVVDEFRIPRRK